MADNSQIKNVILKIKTATINFLFFILFNQAFAQSSIETIPIIPLPNQIAIGQGYFKINSNTVICFSDSTVISDIKLFNNYLKEKYGFQLDLIQNPTKPPRTISISSNKNIPGDNYTIKIDSNAILIDGGTNAGVFYALQTLIELLPLTKASVLNVPSLHIEDGPAFKYRGMHLDVARHFYSVDVVKRYIDHLALYKMNTFHWHLTDDQGWRIEIKKFPKLQKIGAWRNGTLIGHYFNQPAKYDSIRYGGFYTQEEIKDVVQYAAARHVTIIPEIEMPGHAQAALAAYPELSCTGGPFEVGKTWGVYQDVFCPKEETFDFLEKVLDEVCVLFPGKYIHIGGDECPKDRWKESEYCQKLIRDKNLIDENGLQRYFTNRIASYLKTKNKIAIGWDEILDEHLDSTAAIMSWRGYAGAVDGAKKNHDVVMNPYTHCYFDSYQSRLPDTKLAIGGYIPLEMVYRFDPIPDVLNQDQAKHILGAQGNVWTEYIAYEERINEMIFPRICALAEVLWSLSEVEGWSPKKSRDYSKFTSRLIQHFKFLEFNNIHYSTALYDVSSKVTFDDKHGININLFSTYPKGEIRFSLNGESPTIKSPVFKDVINVDQTVGIKASVFVDSIQKGRIFAKIFTVSRATGRKITLINQPHPEYSNGGINSLTDGSKGDLPWMPKEWLGFLGKDFDATIDLEEAQNISRVAVDALREDAGKIFLPTKVEVSYSIDGINFKPAGSIDSQSIQRFNRSLQVRFPVVQARWIRIVATNANKQDWLMVDEIMVE